MYSINSFRPSTLKKVMQNSVTRRWKDTQLCRNGSTKIQHEWLSIATWSICYNDYVFHWVLTLPSFFLIYHSWGHSLCLLATWNCWLFLFFFRLMENELNFLDDGNNWVLLTKCKEQSKFDHNFSFTARSMPFLHSKKYIYSFFRKACSCFTFLSFNRKKGSSITWKRWQNHFNILESSIAVKWMSLWSNIHHPEIAFYFFISSLLCFAFLPISFFTNR